MATSKIRPQFQLERSTTPGSILISDASNDYQHTAPGTDGDVLTIVGGVPTYSAPTGSSIFESVNTDTLIREAANANQYNRDFVVGSPTLDDDGDTAHDVRMLFDKSKGAFRAGIVNTTDWDNASRGQFSAAFGANTIASGVGSFSCGSSCEASGSNSHAEGDTTIASGNGSHAEGVSSSATGVYAHAEGSETIASGNGSHAGGKQSNAYLDSMHAIASGSFSVEGDAQHSTATSKIATNDATQTELFIGASSRIVLPADRTWFFKVMLAARQTAGTAGTIGDSAAYEYKGVITRDGANNTAIQGTVTEEVIYESNAAWDVTVDADDTNESLRIQVTGELDKTIHWVAKVELVEVG